MAQRSSPFRAIYISEVTGLYLFNTAAKLSLSQRRRYVWATLAKLENQTLSRYLEFEQKFNGPVKYPYSAQFYGYLFGVIFTLLPWRLAMKLLVAGTPSLIEEFERLRQIAPQCSLVFFDYVISHERAIACLARQELNGDTNDSTKVIEQLIR